MNSDEVRKLDIGCGFFKRPGAIGMDHNPDTLADVIHDLNQFPYPFEENRFDEIYCHHVLEHLPNLLGVMEELHRIARPKAKIYIEVPYWSSYRAFTDPTHLRYFTENTFDYFTPKSRMNFYTRARFEVLIKELELSSRFPVRLLAKILPLSVFKLFNNLIANVRFELEAIKAEPSQHVDQERPCVSIVLLNWNNYPDTRDCLKSLARITYPNYNIILVDNHSPDGSGEKIHREFPQHSYLQTQSNLGFSGGCNVGIRYALDHGADYVLLLNNDTVVEPHFLEPLVEIFDTQPGTGLAGGKGYFYDRPNHIHMAGGKIDWLRATYKRFGDNQADCGQFDRSRQVDMISAYFMLVKRDVFSSVGLLPEEYFGGMEECDFVLRVRNAGFKAWYVPRSCVWHKIGRSFTSGSPKYLYNCYRNKILFMKRFLPVRRFRCWLFFFELYARWIASGKLARKASNSGRRVNPDHMRAAIELAFEHAKHKDRITLDDLNETEHAIDALD